VMLISPPLACSATAVVIATAGHNPDGGNRRGQPKHGNLPQLPHPVPSCLCSGSQLGMSSTHQDSYMCVNGKSSNAIPPQYALRPGRRITCF
jgi:hypothetical protein